MQDTPKQTKLLGATVRGLGVIVAVSSTLHFGYAIVEGADRVNHRVALIDLKRDEVAFPAQPQPYRTRTERVAVGTWDEVHSLVSGVVGLAVAA
jgi:hypothetical protein